MMKATVFDSTTISKNQLQEPFSQQVVFCLYKDAYESALS